MICSKSSLFSSRYLNINTTYLCSKLVFHKIISLQVSLAKRLNKCFGTIRIDDATQQFIAYIWMVSESRKPLKNRQKWTRRPSGGPGETLRWHSKRLKRLREPVIISSVYFCDYVNQWNVNTWVFIVRYFGQRQNVSQSIEFVRFWHWTPFFSFNVFNLIKVSQSSWIVFFLLRLFEMSLPYWRQRMGSKPVYDSRAYNFTLAHVAEPSVYPIFRLV